MRFNIARSANAFAFLLLGISTAAMGQTVSLNDGSILRSNPHRAGVNIGAIDYWDNGQMLKNLIGSTNPGFEPLIDQQIWALNVAGTSTTFTVPDNWDGVQPNYWAGGTFKVIESQSGGAELGCTGTIASNTGPNYPTNSGTGHPVVTVSSGCAAPFSIGDQIIMTKVFSPTPESWWETNGLGGFSGVVSGGAQLLSDTTDLCATCGKQSLNLNASAAGSMAEANWYFDSEYNDNIFVLLNGTYQLTFWAKAASGKPVLTAMAARQSAGGMNCGSYTPTLTSGWAEYTFTCTASESASGTTPGNVKVGISVSGGSVYLDNVSFAKSNTDPSNTTAFRDEVIQTLQSFYGPSAGSTPGMLRYWVNQNGETLDNWTNPDYAHAPTSSGKGYFVGPGGSGAENLSLEDYLVICQYLNAEPYLEVPVTFSTTDASNLIEFLAGSSGTYASKRISLGQSEPWTSVFDKIHLSFCNECWNGQSFFGQALPQRTTAPNSEYYYDYSVRARDIFAAMRSNPSYNASSFDLVMNAQTAVSYSMDTAIARAHPDSIEVESYTYGPVASFATDAALWQPAMVDPWMKATNPSDTRHFYQSLHDYQSQTTCGASGTATCNVNIYEWGQGTISGGIDQTHLDYINAGGGEGVVMALQPLLNMQYYGIGPQSFFALSEYKNGAASGMTSKLWGNVVDMGGATNNVRPTFLGVELVNQSVIGPMYSCPIANNLTYNFAGSSNGNGSIPAMSNVPYLYAFCFENGSQRSLVLINTDLTNSHSISFSGTNPPQGSVTVRQLAPKGLNDMNETHTGTATMLASANVSIQTSSLSNPTSVTLPPFSATALDYTVNGSTTPTATAASPVFSPAAGTYTTAQTVTLTDSTSGAKIYFTTNGTTPTTSSALYTGPISVSSSQTIQAIAVASGYTNSGPSSATYTINGSLPTPVFSPAGGSYTSAQSVSISDATAGTTIYYTTNGSAPTTSSAVYAGPISVSASQTVNAIAVKSGYGNSAVASASYTISQAVAAAPVFSPAGGSYTSAQSITIADATSGATIYYTTNGSTPTTSSAVYSGPVAVGSSATIRAMAVKSGYTNSAVSSAAYTITIATAPITLPTPTLSPAGGTYSSTQTVSAADATSGVTIYYTTDGSTPTTSSAVYSSPITISLSKTLKAIAVKSGYANSGMASASYTITTSSGTGTTTTGLPTYINYGANGFTIKNMSLNYGASISGGDLILTDGGLRENRSAWSLTKVPVNNFITDFTFQLVNAKADGFTFTIQNDRKGIWALGGPNAGLGYQGIGKSVAVKFDIYNNAGEGNDSTGVFTNGALPTGPSTDLSKTGVVLASGDVIQAHLVYSGTTLTLTLTDTKTKATVTKQFTINIPGVVGSNTAYVGFTGGTGSNGALQKILSWSFQ